jgi:hypothetical protein
VDKEHRLTKLQEENAQFINIFDDKDTEISTLTNYLEDLKSSQEASNQ